MKSLLVIGGTGFIGYHVISEAKKRGYKIYSVSLHKPKNKRVHKGIKYIKADITNFKAFKKKIKINFRYVINAGGYGYHPDFGKEGNKIIKDHFLGLTNILNVLEFKKLKKFIHLGSSAEYGNVKSRLKESNKCAPNTPYSIAKISCTQLLLNLFKINKFPVTILRLFQVYGPKQDNNRIIPFIINNCLKDKKFTTTRGDQLCDFCYIDDVVKAIFKSLESKKTNGEIINIGSGKPTKIKSVILLITKLIKKGSPIIGALNYKKNTNMKNYPSIAKAKQKLKWKPIVELNKGIKKTIKSYK